jgi:hypothetical protein
MNDSGDRRPESNCVRASEPRATAVAARMKFFKILSQYGVGAMALSQRFLNDRDDYVASRAPHAHYGRSGNKATVTPTSMHIILYQ